MSKNLNSKRSKKTTIKTKAGKKVSRRRSHIERIKRAKIKDKVLLDLPHYPQTEDFTSAAACAMMVLKHLNNRFQLKKENEYDIWQEAVSGSVWYGSKYGLAYALAKRGADVAIISNTQDEGYDKRMAVYENVNLDTLAASFNEIKQKAHDAGIEEEYTQNISLTTIKKALSAGYIPIILIDAKAVDTYLDSMPHWVVVKGYDKDNIYINDPYSDSTITLDNESLKAAFGFENDMHMILIKRK